MNCLKCKDFEQLYGEINKALKEMFNSSEVHLVLKMTESKMDIIGRKEA